MNLININEPGSNKSKKSLCLGIDFGTTNSVCSVKKNDKVIYVKDFDKEIIPSIVLFKK